MRKGAVLPLVVIGGVIIIVAAALFYWFQYRPTQIRNKCLRYATNMEDITGKKNLKYEKYDTTNPEEAQSRNDFCLEKYGLK